jgi:hypothetical protein
MRAVCLLCCAVLGSLILVRPSTVARAQSASLELSFTPTKRAQVAVWVEREDGTFMGTLALTFAVAKVGIGNRPGALQFNSGYRWPYGRREGVLPTWAHRRAAAPGAQQWKRVIFQSRAEGFASQTASDESPDHHYCLSFVSDKSSKAALDAVSCASVFSSDKGRYITDADVANGYSEPFEDGPGRGRTRTLALTSLYPPRRDVERCAQDGCFDHADVNDFRNHASAVMPELDAVTRATLQGGLPAQWIFPVPVSWPVDARYKLFVEVNVEGDHNGSFDDRSHPTPRTPMGAWDIYATGYGYPYRGQPSVVYELPFTLQAASSVSTRDPIGHGALHGESGTLTPLNATISNDPVAGPGSGADRLLAQNGVRASLRVLNHDTPECFQGSAPSAVADLKLAAHPERKHAHAWARLSFKSPPTTREISSYVVEIKTDDGMFEPAFTPDTEQLLMPVALDMCRDPQDASRNRCITMAPGTSMEATIAGLRASTHYTVRVSARDRACAQLGPSASAAFKTSTQAFATVSPCFVASAAYGSPLAAEIHVLRALRDRHLANHALGRGLIRVYYALGPTLAAPVAEHAWLATAGRALLAPVVRVAEWLTAD